MLIRWLNIFVDGLWNEKQDDLGLLGHGPLESTWKTMPPDVEPKEGGLK